MSSMVMVIDQWSLPLVMVIGHVGLNSKSKCHEVSIAFLAEEPESVVELDHGVGTVEGHLIAALLPCQQSQCCQQQLPQLPTSHLKTRNMWFRNCESYKQQHHYHHHHRQYHHHNHPHHHH